jgi:hypothetical protein
MFAENVYYAQILTLANLRLPFFKLSLNQTFDAMCTLYALCSFSMQYRHHTKIGFIFNFYLFKSLKFHRFV